MSDRRDSDVSLTLSAGGDSLGPLALPDLSSTDQDPIQGPLHAMAKRNEFLTPRRQSDPDATRPKTLHKLDDIGQLKKRIKDLEKQLEELKVKFDEQGSSGNVTRMKAELDKSRQQMKEMQKKLAIAESSLLETRKIIQSLNKNSAADQKKIKELQEKEQQLAKQMRVLSDELTKKEASLKQMKKTVENLQTELKLSKEDSKRSMQNLEERMMNKFQNLEKRMNDRDARERGPCSETTTDISVQDGVTDAAPVAAERHQTGTFQLPPINKFMFPPK